MNGWAGVYQNVMDAQQMNNFLLCQMNNNMNQMNQMNPMQFNNMNFMQGNNPLAQIQMTSNMIQNNSPQVQGGGFQNMNMNINQNQNQNYKVNLCFSTVQGARIMMAFDSNETVDGALTKFLKRCNLDYLIHNIDKELTFLLSGQSLKFGNFKKLKDVVLMPLNVTNVLVIDTNNLIGA